MNSILTQIKKELRENRDPHTAASGKTFFKEEVKIIGVKTALVNQIGKKYGKEIRTMDKKSVFTLCEELWKSGYLEESFLACHFSFMLRKLYEIDDFVVFERWVKKYVSNWASCDTFCNHTVGAFIEMYPEYIQNLKKWTHSSNRWVKRASAVTFILPARHGKFIDDIFVIADLLLEDKNDLVQKGYGWMLKVASEAHQDGVFEYVMKNKTKMPRTALRYAIEKMPASLKKRAMAK